MSKAKEIVAVVEKETPGLLDRISQEDGLTKEELVRKILAFSHGKAVCAHQNRGANYFIMKKGNNQNDK